MLGVQPLAGEETTDTGEALQPTKQTSLVPVFQTNRDNFLSEGPRKMVHKVTMDTVRSITLFCQWDD